MRGKDQESRALWQRKSLRWAHQPSRAARLAEGIPEFRTKERETMAQSLGCGTFTKGRACLVGTPKGEEDRNS